MFHRGGQTGSGPFPVVSFRPYRGSQSLADSSRCVANLQDLRSSSTILRQQFGDDFGRKNCKQGDEAKGPKRLNSPRRVGNLFSKAFDKKVSVASTSRGDQGADDEADVESFDLSLGDENDGASSGEEKRRRKCRRQFGLQSLRNLRALLLVSKD